MIISVDTELMNEMATLASNANSELDICIAILTAITSHNDWNCKERDAINDNIATVKKNAGMLKENMDIFASSVRQIADQFRTFEGTMLQQFQGAESSFGQTISSFLNGDISLNQNAGFVSQQTAEYISSELLTQDRLENYAVGNMLEPLQVCEYNAFKPSFDLVGPGGQFKPSNFMVLDNEKIHDVLNSMFTGGTDNG